MQQRRRDVVEQVRVVYLNHQATLVTDRHQRLRCGAQRFARQVGGKQLRNAPS